MAGKAGRGRILAQRGSMHKNLEVRELYSHSGSCKSSRRVAEGLAVEELKGLRLELLAGASHEGHMGHAKGLLCDPLI